MEIGSSREESIRLFVLVPTLGDAYEVHAVPYDVALDCSADRRPSDRVGRPRFLVEARGLSEAEVL